MRDTAALLYGSRSSPAAMHSAPMWWWGLQPGTLHMAKYVFYSVSHVLSHVLYFDLKKDLMRERGEHHLGLFGARA